MYSPVPHPSFRGLCENQNPKRSTLVDPTFRNERERYEGLVLLQNPNRILWNRTAWVECWMSLVGTDGLSRARPQKNLSPCLCLSAPTGSACACGCGSSLATRFSKISSATRTPSLNCHHLPAMALHRLWPQRRQYPRKGKKEECTHGENHQTQEREATGTKGRGLQANQTYRGPEETKGVTSARPEGEKGEIQQ